MNRKLRKMPQRSITKGQEDDLDILVVDDSKLMRMVVRAQLEEAGYSVLDQDPSSILDVLKVARAQLPRLLITDYEMPHFTGEMLLRALRSDARFSELQVVMLTSHRDPELITRLVDRGLNAFLLKPLNGEHLLATIRELLGA